MFVEHIGFERQREGSLDEGCRATPLPAGATFPGRSDKELWRLAMRACRFFIPNSRSSYKLSFLTIAPPTVRQMIAEAHSGERGSDEQGWPFP
jgi:hypothetical protein